jgi:hypothetical protein
VESGLSRFAGDTIHIEKAFTDGSVGKGFFVVFQSVSSLSLNAAVNASLSSCDGTLPHLCVVL